jgi:hypothetical protein
MQNKKASPTGSFLPSVMLMQQTINYQFILSQFDNG